MTVTYLELTKAALADVLADLAILESEHDGFTVLGRHYGWDIDRARAARKIALDRCNHDKRTLTIAIASIEAAHERAAVDAALADPTDPMPQDACANGVGDAGATLDYEFVFGVFDRAGLPPKRERDVA